MFGSNVVHRRIQNNYSLAVNSQVFIWIPVRKLWASENNTAHCIQMSGYLSRKLVWDIGLLGRVCDRDETELLWGFFPFCFSEALNRIWKIKTGISKSNYCTRCFVRPFYYMGRFPYLLLLAACDPTCDSNQWLFFVFQWANQTCRFWTRPTLQLRGEVRHSRVEEGGNGLHRWGDLLS